MRWKEEVEEDINNLNKAIKEIDGQIEFMYSEDSLMKHEYQLHAVMVHEGSIDSGHYWAYVLDHKRKVWLKFNDNTVNEASWEELAKESMGGHSNTSAYSLVYIGIYPESVISRNFFSTFPYCRSKQTRTTYGRSMGRKHWWVHERRH